MNEIYREPETAEELAALKAANSEKRRKNSTVSNLIIAVVACLAAMSVLWMIVWRPDGSIVPPVDYKTAVENSRMGYNENIIAPEFPEGWYLNAANVRTDSADKETYWYLGILTDKNHFIALSQRFDAEESWPMRTMDSTFPTGVQTIEGQTWQEYDRRGDKNATGNKPYGLSMDLNGSTVILYGTATEEEFRTVAQLVTK